MKKSDKTFVACGVASAVAVATAVVYACRTGQRNVNLPEGFTVTAHTGCEGTKDNTIESILAGVKAGADVVEIDLHFKADGTAVLSHNNPNGGEASKKLPLLETAFEELSKHDVKMNVDVKSTVNISAVAELAERHGVRDKIFFTGVEEKDVLAIREGAPGIPYYLNVGVDKKKNKDIQYINGLVEKVKNCGAIGINMNFKGASKELVQVFRSEGLLSSVWTANSKSKMYRCLSFEPDNITTRYPSVLKELIK